jgi:TolB-like protein/Tfp pilus assembly protein PilF
LAGSFFRELKKRNVFKVGAAYLVLAWVVAQIADTAVPALHLPDWIVTAVFFFALIGFPFALFFAWVFEITPDGIRKESDIAPAESGAAHAGNKLALGVICMLVLVGGYFIYESRFAPQPQADSSGEGVTAAETQAGPSDSATFTSIAVLPFVNMSSDPEQEYFSDGISEELLNLLTKIPKLQVAARTSSFQFKGRNQNIQEIATRLGVETVLEGSIRKSGSKVRITAQLIKADDGFHMWSNTYDRQLDDIFEIQDEISAAIVTSLKETLGIELVRTAAQARSISPEAHDLYLQGLRDLYIYTFESLESAVAAFQSAIALEPDFALARIKLAETYQFQIQTGSRFDREILDTADSILIDVLASDPGEAQAHYVRSLVASKQGKRKLAEDYVRAAYELNPNQVSVINRYASLLGFELGEEKTRELFARAMRIDPLNFRVTYYFYSYLMHALQEYEEAEALLNAADKDTKDSLYLAVLSSHYRQMGEPAKALHYNSLSTAYDPLDPEGPLYASFLELCLGDGAKALQSADEALGLNEWLGDAIVAKVDALINLGDEKAALALALQVLDDPQYSYRRVTRGDLLAKAVYVLMQTRELKAAEQLIRRHYLDAQSLVNANEPQSRSSDEGRLAIALLSTVLRAQGNEEEAQVVAGSLALLDEDYFTRRQAGLSPRDYLALAEISAMRSRNDLAMGYLESMPNGVFPAWWRSRVVQSPLFLHLEEDSRFISLRTRFEAAMAEQADELIQ